MAGINERKGEYNFNHRKRGTAIVINNINFQQETYQQVRAGAKHDSENLEATLEILGFNVKSYTDLTTTEMLSVLQNEADADHSDEDCFVCAISSHGDEDFVRQNRWATEIERRDIIYAIDGILYLKTITRMFSGVQCTTLRGKPKAFFIQACRGGDLAVSVNQSGEPDMNQVSNEDRVDWGRHSVLVDDVPIYKDFILAYSTPPGFYSFRRGTGSWFITALCDVLQTSHRDLDLVSMLTQVNERVAQDYESNTPSNQRTHRRHIVPWTASMLTKMVCFHPKTDESKRLTFV